MATTQDEKAPGLTVAALHAALGEMIQRGNQDWLVAIPYRSAGVSIGPAPRAPLAGVQAGFDWNQGTVFLQPTVELAAGGNLMAEQARKIDSLQGRLFMAARWLEAEGDTLDAARMAELKKFLGDKK